ncbi:MAG: hypothetical protein JO015_06080 [Verrucomicrobia bacterium]|nr:hypothetical protein [Verrucomicrobiota bacterium]
MMILPAWNTLSVAQEVALRPAQDAPLPRCSASTNATVVWNAPDTANHGAEVNSEPRTPNAELQTSGSELRTSNSELRTSTSEAWFQIPGSLGDENFVDAGASQAAPQPLAQVLAELARRAQVNFVDPGIPSSETISFNLDGDDADPWAAFTRIVQMRGYRIVYRNDIVTLVRNEQDTLKPAHLITRRFKIYQGNLDAIYVHLEHKGWNQVPYKQLVLSRNSRELVATGPESDVDTLEEVVRSKDFNQHTVKAEVWLEPVKSRPDTATGLAIRLAGTGAVPGSKKPQAVKSLEPGTEENLSLLDVQTERGDNRLQLAINTAILPNGNLEANLNIENDAPAAKARKYNGPASLRRTCNHTFEFSPASQVVQVDGILTPGEKTSLAERLWIGRLFGDKGACCSNARLVLKLSVEGNDEAAPAAPAVPTAPIATPKAGSSPATLADNHAKKGT